MGWLPNPLALLLIMLIDAGLLLLFFRFLLQFCELTKTHPYRKAAYKATAFIEPFNKIFPTLGKGKLNTAVVFFMLLLMWAKLALRFGMAGRDITAWQLFFVGTISGVIAFLNALKWTVLSAVLAGFVVMFSQKIHPLIDVLMQTADPLIAPFRKITPDLGMLDLAPLIAMMGYGFLAQAVGVLASDLLQRL